jgi:hypothetical protein
MKKRILYGVANYEEIVAKNGYFIDKTRYIPELEMIRNPVFLRPRRFVVDDIYADYEFDRSSQIEVHTLLRSHYNGYHFANGDGEAIYNPTLVTHFLVEFCESGGRIPEFLTDLNLRTDLYWVRRITTSYPGSSEEFVDGLVALNAIDYDRNFLTTKFDMKQFFDKGFFPISFYYLGMLTIQDRFNLP